MSVEDGVEGFGDVIDGVNARQFAVGDARGEHVPVLGADLIASKKGVFPCQRVRTDPVFGRVGAEL